MKYHFSIMSIDPDLSDEDNHQKYGGDIEASNDEEAKAIAIQTFKEDEGDLPIMWVRVFKCL